MIPGRIIGATRVLGAPADWNEERDGPCCGLPILDQVTGELPQMLSAWTPTPVELDALNKGGSVILVIVGTVHPVVQVGVSTPPEDGVADV